MDANSRVCLCMRFSLVFFFILCYLSAHFMTMERETRQPEKIGTEKARTTEEERKKRNENLKQQISDIISLLIYLHTPDALFSPHFRTVCVCNYHIAAMDLSFACVIFFPAFFASLPISVRCLSSLWFALYCLQFTPFQLSAVCFFAPHVSWFCASAARHTACRDHSPFMK